MYLFLFAFVFLFCKRSRAGRRAGFAMHASRDAGSQAALSRAKHHAPPGSRAFLGRGASPRPGWGPLGQEGRGRGHAPSQRRGGMKSERPGGVPASGLPGPRTPPAPHRPPLPRQEGWGRDPLLSVLGAAQRKNVHDPPPRRRPSRQSPLKGSALPRPPPSQFPGTPGRAPLGGGVKVQTVAPIGLGGSGGGASLQDVRHWPRRLGAHAGCPGTHPAPQQAGPGAQRHPWGPISSFGGAQR